LYVNVEIGRRREVGKMKKKNKKKIKKKVRGEG
jgi:hypothetical protein